MARGLARGDVRVHHFSPPDKTRPVVVLTRDSVMGHLSKLTVALITSTIRVVQSEVVMSEADGMKTPCAVNLHNTITVYQSQMGKRLTQLGPERMGEICTALQFALGCDFSEAT